MPIRKMVLSWIVCCVVVGSLAIGVSCAQTASSAPVPKAQTSKLGPACSAKTKATAELAQQPDYQAADDAVGKADQAAVDAAAGKIDPVLAEIDRVPNFDALSDDTMEKASHFLSSDVDQDYACLLAALGNGQINNAKRLAESLQTAWNKQFYVLQVKAERYQKASDDEAVGSPRDLQYYGNGCNQALKAFQVAVSRVGMPILDAVDGVTQGKLADIDPDPHPKALDYLGAKMQMNLWCAGAAAIGDATARSSTLHLILNASDAAEHKIHLLTDSYNSLLGYYHNLREAYDEQQKALDRDYELLVEDQKILAEDAALLRLPLTQPVILAPPPVFYAPPQPEELHCTSQTLGDSTYTNCY